MDAQFEQFAEQVKQDADKMQFKTEKQIDDFIKSIENDENDD